MEFACSLKQSYSLKKCYFDNRLTDFKEVSEYPLWQLGVYKNCVDGKAQLEEQIQMLYLERGCIQLVTASWLVEWRKSKLIFHEDILHTFHAEMTTARVPRSVCALNTCLFYLWCSQGFVLPSHCPCSSVMEPCIARPLPSSVFFLSVPQVPALGAITPLPLVRIRMPSS